MVLRRHWVDDQSFLAMMGLSQVFPGANGVKLTVLIGLRLHGPAGAAVALFGLLSGPFMIVLAIGTLYAGIGQHSIVHAMLDGVAAAVIGLTLATGLRSLARSKPGPLGLAIAVATVAGVGVLRWPMLPVVATLVPVSIGLALAKARRP